MRKLRAGIVGCGGIANGKHPVSYTHLLYQINPHFLLNTLNSIQWMAQMSHQREISELSLIHIYTGRTDQNISGAAERRGRIGKSKGGFRKRI